MAYLDDYLIPKPAGDTDSYRFATVTGISPLRVRLDGDSTPVDIPPVALCSVDTGDRVLVQIHGRQLWIVGRVTAAGDLAIPRLRLTSVNDVSETSTAHGFQIGPSSGINLRMDVNEIMSVNGAGAVQELWLGNPCCGQNPTVASALTRKEYVDNRTYGGYVTITPSAANTPTGVNVTFPAGKFGGVTPSACATANSTVPGTTVTGTGISNLSATGCTVYVTRTNTTATGVYIVAVPRD